MWVACKPLNTFLEKNREKTPFCKIVQKTTIGMKKKVYKLRRTIFFLTRALKKIIITYDDSTYNVATTISS